MDQESSGISIMDRLRLAFRVLFNGEFVREAVAALRLQETRKNLPPERLHASGLLMLSLLQREGRLIDFLQQDVASFSDEEVGAAARVVHGGCRRALGQYLVFEPAVRESEGSSMTIPKGFDAQKVRITGNVAGEPPFRGVLKHHGWVAREIRLPEISEALDPRVVAPAEVELS